MQLYFGLAEKNQGVLSYFPPPTLVTLSLLSYSRGIYSIGEVIFQEFFFYVAGKKLSTEPNWKPVGKRTNTHRTGGAGRGNVRVRCCTSDKSRAFSFFRPLPVASFFVYSSVLPSFCLCFCFFGHKKRTKRSKPRC